MAPTALTPNQWSGWNPALNVTAEHVDTFGSTRAYLVRVDGAPVGWVFSRPGSTHTGRREWDLTTTDSQWRKAGNVYPLAGRHDAVVALLERA